MTKEELQAEAERCRRLAAGMSNKDLSQKLTALAAEMEAAASADAEQDASLCVQLRGRPHAA